VFLVQFVFHLRLGALEPFHGVRQRLVNLRRAIIEFQPLAHGMHAAVIRNFRFRRVQLLRTLQNRRDELQLFDEANLSTWSVANFDTTIPRVAGRKRAMTRSRSWCHVRYRSERGHAPGQPWIRVENASRVVKVPLESNAWSAERIIRAEASCALVLL